MKQKNPQALQEKKFPWVPKHHSKLIQPRTLLIIIDYWYSITEQSSEKGITLESSQRQLEKDYEESTFESDSDDLNESETCKPIGNVLIPLMYIPYMLVKASGRKLVIGKIYS